MPIDLSLVEALLAPPCPQKLKDSILYSLTGPGKRIRPRLLTACGNLFGIPAIDLNPAATAIEMIHCFTLIHDDLPCMDDDDYRRGRLSNHKKFDEATALLAGDALLSMAISVFIQSKKSFEPHLVFSALDLLLEASGPQGVMGGQILDLSASRDPNPNLNLSTLELLHRLKTGALFKAAFLVPVILAGIAKGAPEFILVEDLANALGIGFQIVDDYEDVLQDKKILEGGDLSNLFSYGPKSQGLVEQTKKHLAKSLASISQKYPKSCQNLANIVQEVSKKLEVIQ